MYQLFEGSLPRDPRAFISRVDDHGKTRAGAYLPILRGGGGKGNVPERCRPEREGKECPRS